MSGKRFGALISLSLLLMLVCPAAFAQDPGPLDDAGTLAVPTAPEGGLDSARAPDVYVIQSGDTLWDVCSRFIDNPWYWPKLWSLNQYIGNPHFIYPGDELRFFSGGLYELPKLEITRAETQVPAVVEEPAVAEEGEMQAPAIEAQPAEPVVAEAVETAEAPTGYLTRSLSYISEKQFKSAGKIIQSPAEKLMLTEGDTVYLKMKEKRGLSQGDKLTIFEVIKKIDHPTKFWGDIGYQIKVKGVLRITDISPVTVAALILEADRGVLRGDTVLAYKDLYRTIEPSQNEKRMDGLIVGSEQERFLIGQGDIAYVNLGLKQGIKEGNELYVVRRKDGFNDSNEKLPYVVVGKLVIIQAESNAATTFVVENTHALQKGDKVRTYR